MLNPSGYAQVLEELTVSGTTNLVRAYSYGLGLVSQRLPVSAQISLAMMDTVARDSC